MPVPAPLAAAPTAPAANRAKPGYIGERPVEAAWLTAREAAFSAIRGDYERVRTQALSANAAAAPVQIGFDEGGPVFSRPAGQWAEFNEDAFAASYRASNGAPLQAVAKLYDAGAATLLSQHPELWRIATTDHALNAGPAASGFAMGSAGQLGMVDLYLADAQIAALVDACGGKPAAATGGIALEQVRQYGQARYEQMSRRGNAMQSVREQYAGALASAAAGGSNAGRVEREVAVYATDESGQRLGQSGTFTERVFDPDAFTAWYLKQDGIANKAFADFYGQSTTATSTDESAVDSLGRPGESAYCASERVFKAGTHSRL